MQLGDVLRVEADNVTESGFACSIENGVLIVRETRDASWSNTLSRLISVGKKEPEYRVWLPKDLVLTRAELSIAAGTAELNALRADTLRLQMSAGDVSLTSLRTQSVLVELAAGNLRLYDLDTKLLSLQAAAGSVGVSGTVRERCTVDLAAGSAALRLTGNAADYTAQLDVAAGAIDYDGYGYSFTRASVGHGEGHMSLRCGAGNIDVKFFG